MGGPNLYPHPHPHLAPNPDPNPHQVWYEWALVQPQLSPIHNVNGRSYHIGL